MVTMTATTTLPPSTVLSEKMTSVDLKSPSLNSSSTPESHYKNWPNALGFEADYEQHTPIDLKVSGKIPSYAAGTLYRTGPGTYKVPTNKGGLFEAQHWFDGLATAHRFQLHEAKDDQGNVTRVSYNSRRTCDKLVQQIKETGEYKGFGFAQKRDPCQNYFKKFMSTFEEVTKRHDPTINNVGVALSMNMPGLTPDGTQTLTARTDAATYLPLDPETLEPAGACNQTVLHPDLKGPLSGTHAKMDPITGDIFNYNLDFGGPKQVYRVFQVSKATGKTTILAKLEAPGAYLHSILLTEHTVVLCVWNSHISKLGLSIPWNNNILDSISPLDPKDKARWYVIDRTAAQRGVIASFTTDPFFCFHTINAFEQPSDTNPGSIDIIADLSGYDDLSMLKGFYYNIMVSSKATDEKLSGRCRPTYRRYKLPGVILPSSKSFKSRSPKSVAGSLITRASGEESVELPTIHPSLYTHRYRYHYGVADQGYASFIDGLGKRDNKTGSFIQWRQFGHTPGEPIFVPDPTADPFDESEEDKGVLLSVVCDGIREVSYLLVLDARDLKEIGRAEMEVVGQGEPKRVVGFGFHGLHVRNEGQAKVCSGD